MKKLKLFKYVTTSVIFCAFLAMTVKSQPPTTNPIAEYYGNDEGYPAWTDEINWDNTINMNNYDNGQTTFEKFENARDELYQQGGGVLYYPASGSPYTFNNIPQGPNGRGLMLKKGVVIRGEKPSSDDKAIPNDYVRYTQSGNKPDNAATNTGLKSLGTVFKFPRKDVSNDVPIVKPNADGEAKVPDMWNLIGMMPAEGERLSDVHNVGIAWVKLDGAVIYFGPDSKGFDDGKSYKNSGSWLGSKVTAHGNASRLWGDEDWASRVADGTHYLDVCAGSKTGSEYVDGGKNRFAFGVRMENALANGSPINKCGQNDSLGKDSLVLAPFRFGMRIHIYGDNVFVGNNVIAKSDESFAYKRTLYNRKNDVGPEGMFDENEVLVFDYARSGGIDVNKSLGAFFNNRNRLDTGVFFNRNVLVRDNFVYNTSNKPFEISGKYVVIQNNIAYHDWFVEGTQIYDHLSGVDNWRMDYYGCRWSCCQDDMMARGFDLGGMNVWADSLWWDGYGAVTNVDGMRVNDGEGILVQRHGAVEAFSHVFTRNKQGPIGKGNQGGIEPYRVHTTGYMAFQNVVQQGDGITRGIGVDVGNGSIFYDMSIVDNYLPDGTLLDDCSSLTLDCGEPDKNELVKDEIVQCPGNEPSKPEQVTVEHQPAKERVMISWTAKDSDKNEIGFRVDRKVGNGDWKTIVYRPRHDYTKEFTYDGSDNSGSAPSGFGSPVTMDFNKQQWADYNYPKDKEFQYRVVSVNCNETVNNQTTAESDPLQVASGSQKVQKGTPKTLVVYPNPSDGSYQIKGVEPGQEYRVFNSIGQVLENGTFDSNVTQIDLSGYPGKFFYLKSGQQGIKLIKEQ